MNYSNADNVISRLAFAGDTGDLIKWHELHERLEKSPPPISATERCELLLRLANGGKVTAMQWNQLMGVATLIAPADKAATLSDVQRKGIVEALELRIDNKHGRLIKNLSALVGSTVLLIPSASDHEPKFIIVARDAQGALAYAIWLFMDSAQPFGDALCRCHHQACGRFFLYKQVSRGPPRRKYCSDEHRDAADRENAVQRMRKIRKQSNKRTPT